MAFSKTIPCVDCEPEKSRLILRGYDVLSCTPAGNAMCVISYEYPRAEPAPAAAASARRGKGKRAMGRAGARGAAAGEVLPPWMEIAAREKGVKEYPGDADNPRIVEYHSMTSYGADDDETSWCSSFVNWCMAGAGIRGTRNAAARSWLNWGQALDMPKVGCIVVLWRGSPSSWQGHVGFYAGPHPDNGEYVMLLGGNQGDSVCVSAYEKRRVLGFRWPPG